MALFSSNEVGRYIVIIIWMIINILLFVHTYMDYGTTKKYFYLRQVIKKGLPFARGAAMVLNFNCALILLTMSRNLVSLIRSCNYVCCSRFCSQIQRLLDKTITFHRYIAYMICLMTVVHVGAHCFNFQNLVNSWSETNIIETRLSQLEDDPSKNESWVNPIRKANSDTVTEAFKSIPGVTGVVITLCLILMLSSSTELIRRSYFEVFWYSHHLFVVFYAGLVTHGLGGVLRMQINMEQHDPELCVDTKYWNTLNCTMHKPVFKSRGPTTWMFVIVPMIVYMIERCIRFYRYTQRVDIVSVVKHPSKVIEIKMRKQGFKCEAGQYIFIQCPEISQLEWHPFTLTSAPEENYFSVHIRIVGDWTDALARKSGYYEEEVVPIKDMPRLVVDGPFGTSSTDVFKYDVVMCIGAGIGVTPFASILKSLWYQLNHRAEINVKKVYFFWICPETQSFEWFTSLLKHFETQMEELGQVGFLDIKLFLTRVKDKKMREMIFWYKEQEYDIITGLKSDTYYGRPEWNKIFREIASKHPKTEIGVFYCGPAMLSHDLHKKCNQHTDDVKGVKFFYNKENF